MSRSHPNDLLVIWHAWERHGWPEFGPGQVVSARSATALMGRKSRRVWVTAEAERNMGRTAFERLRVMEATGSVIDRAMHWRPEPEPRGPLGRLVDRFFEFVRVGK